MAAHREYVLVEAHLEGVLAARDPEVTDVLAGDADGAVLDAVAEQERISGAEAGAEEQLDDEHAGLVVAADAAGAAVLQGVHGHAVGGAAGVSVVDGHVPVDAVAVGTDDVVGLAVSQLPVRPDAHALVQPQGVQAAVE